MEFTCDYKSGDGSTISFWEDIWIGETPLKEAFPDLYKLSRSKQVALKDMISAEGAWDLQFSRTLSESEFVQVINLLQIIGDPNNTLNLELHEDGRHWVYGYGKGFTVANAYNALETYGFLCFPDKQLWNPKIPLKVSFLVWTLCYNGAPTLDGLLSAGLVHNNNCLFCSQHTETNAHLFLHCNFTFAIWSYFLASFGIRWVFSSDIKRNLWEWKNKKSKNRIKRLWGYLPFAIWWSVWNERNRRLYKNFSKTVEQVIVDVKSLLYNWALGTDIFTGFTLSTILCNWDAVTHSSM